MAVAVNGKYDTWSNKLDRKPASLEETSLHIHWKVREEHMVD